MTASIADLEVHRRSVTGHCYRMLGSSVDADDAAQETFIRAWRGLDRFDGRSSAQTWLYRIATNVCLDELAARGKRARPIEEGPPGSTTDTLTKKAREHWLEPIADAKALPDTDPLERVQLRQSIRLAFVAALQRLAPKQRAALLLTEVLGWSTAEVAETLATTVAAVNSALQRARAVVGSWNGVATELTEAQTLLVDRYVSAFERYDVDELTSLLKEDATLSMPPFELWLQGPQAVKDWMLGVGSGCRGSRLVPIAACGSPAFAQYRVNPAGGFAAWALIVLELQDDRITGLNSFLDTETLFPRFDLPLQIF